MAFPTITSATDDFSVLQDPLSLARGWAQNRYNAVSGSRLLKSNGTQALAGVSTAFCSQMRDAVVGPDTEVGLQIPTLSADGTELVGLFARAVQDGATTVDTYALFVSKVAGAANDTWEIHRIVNNGNTILTPATVAQEVAAGDHVGFEVTGTGATVTLTGYLCLAANNPAVPANWTQIIQRLDTNAARLVAAGRTGIEVNTDAARFARWFDGTVVVGGGTSFPRTAADSVTVSDAATRAAIAPARTAADTATVSEAATRSTPKGRTAADSVAVSDTAVGTGGTSRTAADSISATDAAVRAAVSRARTGADTASVSDSAARSFAPARTAADSATVTDTAARATVARARTSSDAATIADSAIVSGTVSNLTRTAADSLTATDAATRATFKARSATDTAAVTDQAARAATSRIRTATDPVTVTDTAARLIARLRTSSDAVTITEAAAGVPVVMRAAADAVTVSDLLARGLLVLVRGAGDLVVITDAAAGTPHALVPPFTYGGDDVPTFTYGGASPTFTYGGDDVPTFTYGG